MEKLPDNAGTFEGLLKIVERLRSPQGCPWDREQTHASLKRNLLEECYETLEAIDRSEGGKLAEELGDLLIQVAFHCQMAQEAREFTVSEAFKLAADKLVRRHPHVFGNAKASTAKEVEHQWERLKQTEKPGKSPVQGIPAELPSLAYTQLVQERVAKAGFDWDSVEDVYTKVQEEIGELRKASTTEEKMHEVGDLLFAVVNLSRWLGVHAEDALRQANARFKRRYLEMERMSRERGLDFTELSIDEKEQLWQQVKAQEKDR